MSASHRKDTIPELPAFPTSEQIAADLRVCDFNDPLFAYFGDKVPQRMPTEKPAQHQVLNQDVEKFVNIFGDIAQREAAAAACLDKLDALKNEAFLKQREVEAKLESLEKATNKFE